MMGVDLAEALKERKQGYMTFSERKHSGGNEEWETFIQKIKGHEMKKNQSLKSPLGKVLCLS